MNLYAESSSVTDGTNTSPRASSDDTVTSRISHTQPFVVKMGKSALCIYVSS